MHGNLFPEEKTNRASGFLGRCSLRTRDSVERAIFGGFSAALKPSTDRILIVLYDFLISPY
jgi:hypothetical protein